MSKDDEIEMKTTKIRPLDDDDEDEEPSHVPEISVDDFNHDGKPKNWRARIEEVLFGRPAFRQLKEMTGLNEDMTHKERFKKVITPKRIKLIGILVIMSASLYMFTNPYLEEEALLNLAALDNASPIVYEIEKNSDKENPAYIKIRGTLQQRQQLRENTTINFHLQLLKGEGESGEWIDMEEPLVFFYEEHLDDKEPTIIKQWKVNTQSNGVIITNDLRIFVDTTSEDPVGITFTVANLPWFVAYETLFAALILVGVYVLIIFELVHRTIAALFGSFVALAILSKIHEQPTLATVASWIDYNTVGLLFGMMLMVGILSTTGFFEWTAIKVFRLSGGNVWYLMVLMCTLISVLSAFLDNVTTMLLLAPVTLKLCKVLSLPPEPIIISEVMFTNLGGTATIIGDPPNIIIANHPEIVQSGVVTFSSFIAHMAPGTILAMIGCFFLVRRVYVQDVEAFKDPTYATKMEIDRWKRTLKQLPKNTPTEKAVRKQLEDVINNLEKETKEKKAKSGGSILGHVDIGALEKKYRITNYKLVFESLLVIGSVVFMFFIHSAVELHLDMTWVAIIGAMVHLLVAGIREIEEVLNKVEWGTLLFFGALFVLMRALEEMGLILWIGENTASMIAHFPAGDTRLVAAVCIILWVSAFVSAFVDNIPFTTAMVPIITRLAESGLGLPLGPMVWALVFGACFGGNATIIGASANVVSTGICEGEGYPVSFSRFLKIGMPVMLLTVFISNVYLVVFHVFIPWY